MTTDEIEAAKARAAFSQVQAINGPTPQTWDDYENGCLMTYGGGYRDDRESNAFKHGMQTVFNLLRAEFPPAESIKSLADECLRLREDLAEVSDYIQAAKKELGSEQHSGVILAEGIKHIRKDLDAARAEWHKEREESLSKWYEANQRIADLETQLAACREALEPFAKYANAVGEGWSDDTSTSLLFQQPDGTMSHDPGVNLGDCRKAAAVLAATKGGE